MAAKFSALALLALLLAACAPLPPPPPPVTCDRTTTLHGELTWQKIDIDPLFRKQWTVPLSLTVYINTLGILCGSEWTVTVAGLSITVPVTETDGKYKIAFDYFDKEMGVMANASLILWGSPALVTGTGALYYAAYPLALGYARLS